MADLDWIDVQLLNLLQGDARLTAATLAEKAYASPSAITRRIQRLRAGGVIAAEIAVVPMTDRLRRTGAILHVQLERHTRRYFERVRDELISDPRIQLCVELSGAWDMLVLINTRTIEEMTDFVDETFSKNEGVRRWETSFIKRRLKHSLVVELDDRDSNKP